MASRASAAFTCSFTRRNCPHSSLFHDAYQRTNRTRGTKILRCFPHCCPRHVERSYCGGPVYLQVDLVHIDSKPVEDETLCVFAHFHPHAEDGLALGELVSREVFSPSQQQTDTNPVGEWIGARLVASADRTTWMFEVNPSGRWYYQWESGATKAQRATEHLFEVYVLLQQPTLDEYQVVAQASSPNFKMISFRRAPTEKAGGPTTGLSTVTIPSAPAFEEDEEKSEPPAQQQFHRDSISSAASIDTDLASLTQAHTGIYDSMNESSPRDIDEQTDSFPEHAVRLNEDPARAPLSLLPSADVVLVSRQLATLVELVQTLPSTALDAVLLPIQTMLVSPMTSGGSASYDASVLAALVASPLSSSLSHPPSDDPPQPQLVYTALEFALWILFDAELARIQENWLQHASTGLLEKVALYGSYYSWLRNFQHSVNARLEATNPSGPNLAGLATAARRWLDAHGGSTPPHSQECCGLEAFIAQAREVFLASSGLATNPPRRRPTKQARDTPSLSSFSSAAASWQGLRLFIGSWQADLSSLQWHPVTFTPASSSFSPSAFVTLWTWRQLLAFKLALADLQDSLPPGTPPTLEISSHWNPSAANSRCSRLVLDGKPRWLRVFPSGESTSSVLLGSQRLDHYIASIRNEPNELLTNCYTWPDAQSSGETSCFCLRVSLRYQPASEHAAEGLCVRVAVECGRLRRGVDVVALGESSLANKLQAVEQWTMLQSLEYECRRQDPTN